MMSTRASVVSRWARRRAVSRAAAGGRRPARARRRRRLGPSASGRVWGTTRRRWPHASQRPVTAPRVSRYPGQLVSSPMSASQSVGRSGAGVASSGLVSRPLRPPRIALLGRRPVDRARGVARAPGRRRAGGRGPGPDRRPCPADKVVSDVAMAGRPGAAAAGRRHDLHRADPGGEPEGQAHRGQQRVRHLRPARSPDRRRPPGRAEHAQEGDPGPRQLRPVHDPQAAGGRRARQRAHGAHPAGQGPQVPRDRAGRHGQRGRRDRAAERDRQDPVLARGRRPAVGLDQRRELAGLELQHPGPHRRRGRPHHQDVGGPGQDHVHHGRQLRGAHPPAPAGPAAYARRVAPPSASTPPSSRTPAASAERPARPEA